MKRSDYEPELPFLRDKIVPSDVVLDVGANVGIYSLVLGSALDPTTGCVYAIEPGHAALRLLRTNCETLNSNIPIKVLDTALSDSVGEAQLFHIAGSLTTFSLSGTGGERAESVKTTTLDQLAHDLGLKSLDLIKIDVEGHEPKVFRGGKDTLERFKPLIMFEVSHEALHRGGETRGAPLKLLRSAGYDIYNLDSDRLELLRGEPEGNFFAVHPDSVWPRRLTDAGAL